MMAAGEPEVASKDRMNSRPISREREGRDAMGRVVSFMGYFLEGIFG